MGENNAHLFKLKVSIIANLSEEQTFYKEVIKRLIVRPEFQESGSRYLLHNNAVLSPTSW